MICVWSIACFESYIKTSFTHGTRCILKHIADAVINASDLSIYLSPWLTLQLVVIQISKTSYKISYTDNYIHIFLF